MKFVIDIDGVICNEDVSVPERQGFQQRIEYINGLYDSGHDIVFFTARGMNSQKDNQQKADAKYRELTIAQLDKWGCKYHELFLGKPNCDYYIDNKNYDMEKFFNDDLNLQR